MPRNLMKLLVPAGAMLALMAGPAHATETNFASYSGAKNATFVATQTGGNAGSLNFSVSTAVKFSYDETSLESLGPINAILTLTATTPNADLTGSGAFGTLVDQNPVTGSFSFTSTSAITVGSTVYAAGSNLLTGTFDHADFNGLVGGRTASFTGDSTFGNLTYTSDLLSFANTVGRDFSMDISSLNPVLTVNNNPEYIDSFKATPAGTFGSDPEPLVIADVPEPATWAMMLVGLGAIGLSLRSRSRRGARIA